MKYNSISVIIPVYNVECYVEQCLKSVFEQTVPFDEIIVVNDGSTDKSGMICRRYKQMYPKMILIEQENKGLSEARNNAMQRATGDYVVFADSDDWVSEKLCETVKKTLVDYDVDVVYYASQIVKETSVKIADEAYGRERATANIVMSGFESLKRLFPAYYQMSACMAAYSRHLLKKSNINFIKDILYEDRFFSLRVITEAKKVVYITDKLYIRRFRNASICMSPVSMKKISDVIYGHQKEWQYIRNSKKWKDEKNLTQYYALCSALMAYQNDITSDEMKEEREEYLITFFEQWLEYFEIESMGINESCALLLMVKNAAESDNQNLLDLFEDYGGIRQYQKQIKNLLMEKSKERLKKLPFGEKKRIALYGAGQHTNCLLQLYRNLIGSICAELSLIVSNTGDVDSDSAIVMNPLENIADEWDFYLLSSKIYQEDMFQNLMKKLIPKEKVYKLYGKNDAVDCVMIYRALFG